MSDQISISTQEYSCRATASRSPAASQSRRPHSARASKRSCYPCIRQRPSGIAGAWHGGPLRVHARHFNARCKGNCVGLFLLFRLGPPPGSRPCPQLPPGPRDRGLGEVRRRRKAPAHQYQLALAITCGPNNRRHRVRADGRQEGDCPSGRARYERGVAWPLASE